MFRLLLPCLALTGIAFSLPSARAVETAEPLRPAVECTVRGGLPNVLAKLQAGKEVRVGYFGGSITAAPGWRVKSLKWLQQQYPAAKISEIDAAIGGTGSDLGVFRAQHDVLQFKPDLLFVEFAVNDGGTAPEQIQRCMEGIVRQTWRADSSTDMCFVYTVSLPYLADLKAGNDSRAATAMEGVADHYQIPSIHLGIEVARMEKEGKLIFKADKPKEPQAPDAPMIFSEDGVHPLVNTGHELYLQAIQRSLPKLETAGVGARPHELIAPLRADNWEEAKLVPITQDMLRGDWKALDLAKDDLGKRFASRLPGLWKAASPGAALEVDIDGTQAAVYDLLGPDCGQIEFQVDEQPTRKLARFDAYCTGHRLGKAVVLSDAPISRHHLRLTLLAEAPEKAKILFEKNRPDLEKNPEKYANDYWYAGGLLILGDVAK
jgi:GDSL-like Lipase/Acylhydrolase family